MPRPDWLSEAQNVVEKFTGERPRSTVLHLMENGQRITPVLTTAEGRAHYIARYLLGDYNPETQNALFPSFGTAMDGAKVLSLMGYDAIDVTDLILRKRGIDPKKLALADPEKLQDLQNEPVSLEELKSLLTQEK